MGQWSRTVVGTMGALMPTLLAAGTGCGSAQEPLDDRHTAGQKPPFERPKPQQPPVIQSASSQTPSEEPPDAALNKKEYCPADMAYVDTTYCPNVKLHCLKEEYNKPNHIRICHEFEPGQTCVGPSRRQRFCIDKYEYPNQAGAHPPVMVDWYDAAGACAAKGKRLCWESEWVSACEGPEKLPFPYGLKRDPKQCNIDNPWLEPSLEKFYSKDESIAGPELLRLDQSMPSGAKEGCVSGFGVQDLTGNLDEWVIAEATYKKSKWAGLKGGAWGHVRNACRPMTTSHPPEFTYYFISFRCCKDAEPDPEAESDKTLWTPPPMPNHPDPTGQISPGWTSNRRGPNQPPIPDKASATAP